MVPTEPPEAREVSVRGHQRAAVLDRHRRVLRVRHELACGPPLPAQIADEFPVQRAGRDESRGGSPQQFRCEVQRFIERRGRLKIRGLVTMRTRPTRASTERAKGSGPVASALSQDAKRECSG